MSSPKQLKFSYLGHDHVALMTATDFKERGLAMVSRAKQALGTNVHESKLVNMTSDGPPRIASLGHAGK
jgi:hypothetical protein